MQGTEEVDQLVLNVHEAAMKDPLSKVSNLVVATARDLVGADNSRLRFVDYTGKRLVPGAITGALAERLEMCVREIGECIVGRAAELGRVQLVNHVQNDTDFKVFKEKVRKKAETDVGWKEYHDNTLARLGSEIAVPVMAGKALLGVLSVNALKEDAFKQEHQILLSTFAAEIAVAFVNWRARILQELHEIEEEMISVFELKEVAQHTADGIRKMVEGSIPNIFLFDETFDFGERARQREASPYDFLCSAGATDEEKDLGSFDPRWMPRSDQDGLGIQSIKEFKKGRDAFIVVEDVQNDPRGSPTARDRHVKTTGCLPLVFRGMIVGVLYLHFKQYHFFTLEEKRILNMFAVTAAIAIRNATTLPTYGERYGKGLIGQLEKFKPEAR